MTEQKPVSGPQEPPPRGRILLRAGILLCAILFLFLALNYRRRPLGALPGVEQKPAMDEIPAYSRQAPSGPLPATLPADEFDDPDARQAYAVAAKIKPVLYQLPCYCRCDRTDGHKNLLDCFRSYHGSNCFACQREAVFAYEQFQNGKSVEEIRQAIIHGDWQKPSK